MSAPQLKNGDIVTDSHDRPWTIETLLGRGTWGRSYVVRGSDSRERVLKVPLVTGDFPAEDADLAEVCARIAKAQLELLSRGDQPLLPSLEGRVPLANDRVGLLLPRYGASLARQLGAGVSLTEVLAKLNVLARELSGAAVHGNLRPDNLFVDDDGRLVLADPLVAPAHGHWERLVKRAGERRRYLPPEAANAPKGTWDTWALCQILWEAAMATPQPGDPRQARKPTLPDEGLDKVALAMVKDRATARLKSEGANHRFLGRLTTKFSAVLNRGLSHQHEPSPPYRFVDMRSLAERLEEVTALVQPHVLDVGRLILSSHAQGTVFSSGQPVGFSATVSCSAGVAEHEDLVCGVQLRDLDASQHERVPVQGARFSVKTHPSGRMRFDVELPDVRPGRYRARLAFSVKESGLEPRVAESDFEVRPPPGYVPPPAELSGAVPLPFDGSRRPKPVATAPAPAAPAAPRATDATEATEIAGDPIAADAAGLPDDPDHSFPGGELVQGLFPKPLAPTSPGQDHAEREVPLTMRTAPEPVRQAPVRPAPVKLAPVTEAGSDVGATPTPIAPSAGASHPGMPTAGQGSHPGAPRAPLPVVAPSLGKPAAAAAGHAPTGDPESGFGEDLGWGEQSDWKPMHEADPGYTTDVGLDFGAASMLPHDATEELPELESSSPRPSSFTMPTLPPALQDAVNRVRADQNLMLAFAVLGCLCLVAFLALLLKAC